MRLCTVLLFLGKNHVCKFIGCGRNDKFNYVVMQLQVSQSVDGHRKSFIVKGKERNTVTQNRQIALLACNNFSSKEVCIEETRKGSWEL